MQDGVAKEAQTQRAEQLLLDTRVQIDAELIGLKKSVHSLDVAVQRLSEAIGGGPDQRALLCLRDLQEFKDMDEMLLAVLNSYWANQISNQPCSSVIEVHSYLKITPSSLNLQGCSL